MRKKTPKGKKSALKKQQNGNGPYELYRSLPNPNYTSYTPVSRVAQKSRQKGGFKAKLKKLAISLAIILGVILVGAGGYLGYKFLRDFGWNNIASLFDQTKLKGENQGRVNILLAGDSADDPGHSGADLTDSIMLVSIDTKTNNAFMMSIPRDLYVNIPGHGYSKINAAYEYGQADHFSAPGYPSGGMGLLEETVSQKFNVPIDYYALINYSAFKDAVNAVNGIRIDIQSPDPRGLYDPNTHINLPNGWVSLTGPAALNLARARGDGYGSFGFPRADFDRTQHQRQMLIALAGKSTSLGVLSNPVKVGDLFDAYSKNVQTDFKLNELRRLNTIMKKIPQSRIASAALEGATYNGQKDVNLVQGEFYYGQDVLVPTAGIDNYTQIDSYVTQLEARN